MKKIIAVLLILLACHATAVQAMSETVDRIVAKVGDELIMQSDVEAAITNRKALGLPAPTRILDELVLEKILASEIAREKISVSAEIVERAWRERMAATGLSEPAFAAKLARQGLSEMDYKEGLRRELAKQQFISQKIVPAIAIPDAAIRREYNTHRALYQEYGKIRFIQAFLPTAKYPDATSRKKQAETIRQALQRGNATTLIKAASADEFAASGGDSGVVGVEMLSPDIKMVLDALKPGETSPVFTLTTGDFVFKLIARSEPRPLPFNTVSAQIRAKLAGSRSDAELQKYLLARQDETYVEILK